MYLFSFYLESIPLIYKAKVIFERRSQVKYLQCTGRRVAISNEKLCVKLYEMMTAHAVQPDRPSNGHEPASPSDAELREQLLRLGHSAGPITPATRNVYLKKLDKLLAAAGAADHNGYDRFAAAGGGGARRRRPPSPARQPPSPARQPPSPARQPPSPARRPPAPRPDPPQPMDDSDPMDESDSPADPPAYQRAYQRDTPSTQICYSPVEYEFDAVSARYQPPSPVSRPAARSSLYEPDPAPPQPAARSSLYEPDLTPPQLAARSALYEPDLTPPQPAANDSLYRPETLSSGASSRPRHYPDTLYPRSTPRASTSLFSDRRPTPPPARTPTYQTDGARFPAASRPSAFQSDWLPAASPVSRADPSPVTRAEPAAPRPGSLRQRVADWCRPAPPPAAADYDTCSDSEPEEPDEPAPQSALTPSQQLQAFRRRMGAPGAPAGAAPLSERAAARHGASHLVPYCILLLALLFFGLLGLSYLRLARTDEAVDGDTQLEPAAENAAPVSVAVFPICGDPVVQPELGCVAQERLEPAVMLLSTVQPALLAAARDTLCGRRDHQAVPLTELAELTTTNQEQLRDLAVVVAYNSQLGLRANLTAAHVSLSAVGVSTPWLCLAGAALGLLFKWAFTFGAVVAGALVLRGLVIWRHRSQQKQQQQLYQMVERIMDVVKQHTLSVSGSDKPYVAVDHVRDELLTPAERSSRDPMALWSRSVQFIREKESRVREECVMVAGESHTVWRWLPTTGGGRDRRRVWLGQAFQTSSGVNTPVHTRTNCLKIRHMFDPTCETGSGWMQEVRDALLEKCEDMAVMHIAVDDRSTEGLVYVKCRSDADALSAFKRIQGCWFDGRLVSVKFIRLERYHERYPDAADATQPLRPSNPLRRSLADLQLPQAEDD